MEDNYIQKTASPSPLTPTNAKSISSQSIDATKHHQSNKSDNHQFNFEHKNESNIYSHQSSFRKMGKINWPKKWNKKILANKCARLSRFIAVDISYINGKSMEIFQLLHELFFLHKIEWFFNQLVFRTLDVCSAEIYGIWCWDGSGSDMRIYGSRCCWEIIESSGSILLVL